MIKNTRINFLGPARFLTPISIGLAFLALAVVLLFGFSYGIDFAGGQEIQLRLQKSIKTEQIKEALSDEELFGKPSIQQLSTEQEFLIRLEALKDENSNNKRLEALSSTLKTHFEKDGLEIRRVDSVGPQIGKELRRSGILALIYSLLMILIYLGLRFDTKYAPSAVFCLFHDAIITMSIFSLFKLEVNTQTIAAVLAIIGYSLNDTIVTFDRIRENYQILKNKKSFFAICNQSLNEVLSRTLLTSLTTLIAVLAMSLNEVLSRTLLNVFADGVIKDFAFTLGIGVLIGTYSSIYVATPLLLFMNQVKYFQKPQPSGRKSL